MKDPFSIIVNGQNLCVRYKNSGFRLLESRALLKTMLGDVRDHFQLLVITRINLSESAVFTDGRFCLSLKDQFFR